MNGDDSESKEVVKKSTKDRKSCHGTSNKKALERLIQLEEEYLMKPLHPVSVEQVDELYKRRRDLLNN